MIKEINNINKFEDHFPVMLKEVMDALDPKDNEIYVDATFGAGGYSRAILEKANCRLFAIDRDPSVKKFASKIEGLFPNRFTLMMGRFSEIKELLIEQKISEIDGLVLDIGVSSMQIDEEKRGFSFDGDEPLDMRMNQAEQNITAKDIVNNYDFESLSQIIKNFGEEPKAKSIARKIINQRIKAPIIKCCDLAKIVRSCYYGYYKKDPATKTFQALRIYINQELKELESILEASKTIIKSGGRIVVVSFHSLEDRIVKNFFKKESEIAGSGISRYQPNINKSDKKPSFFLKKSTAIIPTDDEIAVNNRSRSAKMRSAIKI